MRVFVDASIFIHWLNKTDDYENIENADYFLVIDKDFRREMSREAAHLPQSTKIVNPKELVSIIVDNQK